MRNPYTEHEMGACSDCYGAERLHEHGPSGGVDVQYPVRQTPARDHPRRWRYRQIMSDYHHRSLTSFTPDTTSLSSQPYLAKDHHAVPISKGAL